MIYTILKVIQYKDDYATLGRSTRHETRIIKTHMQPSAAPQYMKHHGISPSFGLSKFLRTFVFRTIVLHTARKGHSDLRFAY